MLTDGDVTVRPLRMRDAAAWSESRLANEAWLAPWEPRPAEGWAARNSVTGFTAVYRALRRQARAGTAMPFGVCFRGRLVGQVTLGNIVRASYNGGYLGYWVDGRYAGRGIAPTAVALVVDHAFGPGRLHRVEANVRPENAASLRVVQKLGFREEGLHLRYLLIDGAYRDHRSFALTVEDVPEGLLRRWRASGTGR